jgi:hypothetical protein
MSDLDRRPDEPLADWLARLDPKPVPLEAIKNAYTELSQEDKRQFTLWLSRGCGWG